MSSKYIPRAILCLLRLLCIIHDKSEHAWPYYSSKTRAVANKNASVSAHPSDS